MKERSKKARKRHHKPKGRPPQPPEPGPREKDQYNFTDPDSRIMKNSTNDGFDQHYNVQVAADQDSLLIVAQALSNHPNDKQEALPTLNALPAEIGKPEAVAMDNGYFSEANIQDCKKLGIEPYIATGREPHHLDWHTFFQQQPEPPAARGQPHCEDGLQTPNRDRTSNLSIEKMHRGTHDWHHQGNPRLSPILLARLAGGRWRMVSRLPGVQSETHAQPLPGAGVVVARLLVEKDGNLGQDPYSFLFFSPLAETHSTPDSSQTGHFTCLSDKLLVSRKSYIPGCCISSVKRVHSTLG